MGKFIPFEKLSKRAQKELATAHRKTWGGLNPVTRRPENPKAYNRKKLHRQKDYFDGGASFLLLWTTCSRFGICRHKILLLFSRINGIIKVI